MREISFQSCMRQIYLMIKKILNIADDDEKDEATLWDLYKSYRQSAKGNVQRIANVQKDRKSYQVKYK